MLRLAEPEDCLAVARVHVRSWQGAYRKLLPDEYLDNLRPEERAQSYDFATRDPLKLRTVVTVEDNSICGFATTMPSRDSGLPDYGELCALYVDPSYWGRGMGAALMAIAREHLAESGFQNALLWVLAGNVRAEKFYEADKWMHDGTRRTDIVWGVTVDELRYCRNLDSLKKE